MTDCTFYQNSGIPTIGCPPPWSFHFPNIFEFYVYGFPVFFGILLMMAIAIRYRQIKEEYIRRLIIEQPT